MYELARKYNDTQYFLSGSHINISNALESDEGRFLHTITLNRFKNKEQAKRFFDFYNIQNEVSKTIGKAYSNFERVFSANDKTVKIFDLNNPELSKTIARTLESFESRVLQELKQNITVFLVIVDKIDSFDLLFLPVDSNFSIKKNDNGEIASYHYSSNIEVTKEYVRINKMMYPTRINIFPIVKIIDKEVKQGVSWSPTFDFFGSLQQLLLDRISIEWQKLNDGHPIAVTAQYTCSYTDDNGNTCKSGKIITYDTNNNKRVSDCPNCGIGIGPGQQIEVKGVVGSDKAPDLNSAYSKVNTDVKPLQEAIKNADIDKVSTYEAMTGLKYNLAGTSTYENEKHLISDERKAQNILTIFSKEFSKDENFIVDYITLAVKGKIYEKNIKLGTDFNLLTKEDLINSLNTANEAGLPAFMVAKIIEQLNELESHKVLDSLEFEIWSALEPYSGKSLESVLTIASGNDLYIKANFITLISQVKIELQTDSFSVFFIDNSYEKGDGIFFINSLLNKKADEAKRDSEADTVTQISE